MTGRLLNKRHFYSLSQVRNVVTTTRWLRKNGIGRPHVGRHEQQAINHNILNRHYASSNILYGPASLYCVRPENKNSVNSGVPMVFARLCSSEATTSGSKDGKNNQNDSYKYIFIYSAAFFGIGALLFGGNIGRSGDNYRIPYVVLGEGTSALLAAQGVRLNDPKAKVLIVSEDKYLPYKKDILMEELWYSPDEMADKLEVPSKDRDGKIFGKSIFHEEEDYYLKVDELTKAANGGVGVIKDTKVKKIDHKKKCVTLEGNKKICYDKLCITADMKQIESPNFESDQYTTAFNSVDDFKKLRKIASNGITIAVIGGGVDACHLAHSIANFHPYTKVRQIFPEEYILADILPEYLAEFCTSELNIVAPNMAGRQVEDKTYNEAERKVELKLTSGEKVTVDHVILASKHKPNNSYVNKLKQTKLRMDEDHKAVKVNACLEAAKDIYMAGDGIVYDDATLGSRQFSGAEQQEITGLLAGENMTGANSKMTRHALRSCFVSSRAYFAYIGDCNSKYDTVSYFPMPEDGGVTHEPDLKQPGIVFYMRAGVVRGVLLWNMTGPRFYMATDIARQVLKSYIGMDELHEIVKKAKLNSFDEYYAESKKAWEEESQKEHEFEMPMGMDDNVENDKV